MNVRQVLSIGTRILTAALVTAVTVAGFSGPSAATATAASAAPADGIAVVATQASPALARATYESQVLAGVNKVRRAHGLRALWLASCTDTAAERWAAHLAATGQFYHQSMTRLLDRCHAYYAGETLGRGTISPGTLVRMWMQSAPHRRILMSSSPRRIGIGAVPNGRGEWVVAANFMRF